MSNSIMSVPTCKLKKWFKFMIFRNLCSKQKILIRMSFEKPAVVIDNGSFTVKAGFACDNHPISMFRNVVGRPNYLKGRYGKSHYDVYIGDEALEIGDLEISRPVENGKIVHWDNIERIWHHVYYKELKAASEDRAVILATSPSATMEERIKCCEIFFETLNAPALCIQSQSVLGMYGSGLTTGVCVDMGHDTTDVVPVFEGGMIKYAKIQTGLAGSQISDYMTKCLHDYFTENESHSIHLENVKRKCYVTSNGAMPRCDCIRKYTLPSGEEIDVSNECFMAAEMIFQPDLVLNGKTNYTPLHDAIVTATSKCDPELQSQLYNSIVLCGGVAMIPGIEKRLAHEIENKVQASVEILSSSENYAVPWLGGAIFAHLEDARKMWIQKEQYEECGERIIRNKFPL